MLLFALEPHSLLEAEAVEQVFDDLHLALSYFGDFFVLRVCVVGRVLVRLDDLLVLLHRFFYFLHLSLAKALGVFLLALSKLLHRLLLDQLDFLEQRANLFRRPFLLLESLVSLLQLMKLSRQSVALC